MRAVRLPSRQRPGHERPSRRLRAAVGGATPEPAASVNRSRRDHRGRVPRGNGNKTKPVLRGALASGAKLPRSARSIAGRVHVLERRNPAQHMPEQFRGFFVFDHFQSTFAGMALGHRFGLRIVFFFDLVHVAVCFRKELPTLTETIISGHAESLASCTARDNRFSISATLSFVTSGRTSTNSSPPRRPTWSYSRQDDLNLAAIS